MRKSVAATSTAILVFGGVLLTARPASTHNPSPVPMPTPVPIPEDHTSAQWHLEEINALEAWQITTGSRDVIVAVIDTGVDYNHPDLGPNIWINTDEIPGDREDNDNNGYIDDCLGWDFIRENGFPMPGDGEGAEHGTNLAGIIGAVHGNGGVNGVSGQVQIMAIRAVPIAEFTDYRGCKGGYARNIAEGIRYAVDNGAAVINLSIGLGLATELSGCVQDAVWYAYGKGRVIVAGSGDDDKDSLAFPASMKEPVIAVGATDRQNHRLLAPGGKGSSYGDGLDVMAPGEYIWTTAPNKKYEPASGTSVAAPQVAGLAALLFAADPSLRSPSFRGTRVQGHIEAHTQQVGGYIYQNGWNDQMGRGLIDAYAAIRAALTVSVDNSDPQFVSTGPTEYWHRVDYGYANNATWTYNETAGVVNSARWVPNLRKDGIYRVEAYIPRHRDELDKPYTQSALYRIVHGGIETEVPRNQTSASDSWLDLGIHYFEADGEEYVQLYDQTGEPYMSTVVMFDAIRWEPAESSTTDMFNASAPGGMIYEIVMAGETAELQFTVQNTGLLTWLGGDFAFRGDPDNPEEAPESLGLSEQVKPGDTISWTVRIPISGAPGVRRVSYQMHHNTDPFGDVITGYIFVLPEQLANMEEKLRKQIDEWISKGEQTAEEIAQKIWEAIQKEIEKQVRNLFEELFAQCQANAGLIVLASALICYRSRRLRN